jgi:membrane dipeptidase
MVGVNFAVAFLRGDGGESEDTTLETVVRQIDYLVERTGIDRVGCGSDFDGAKVPEGIRDVSGLPNGLAALRAAGYDEASLSKLAHENWVRVLRATWRG